MSGSRSSSRHTLTTSFSSTPGGLCTTVLRNEQAAIRHGRDSSCRTITGHMELELDSYTLSLPQDSISCDIRSLSSCRASAWTRLTVVSQQAIISLARKKPHTDRPRASLARSFWTAAGCSLSHSRWLLGCVLTCIRTSQLARAALHPQTLLTTI